MFKNNICCLSFFLGKEILFIGLCFLSLSSIFVLWRVVGRRCATAEDAEPAVYNRGSNMTGAFLGRRTVHHAPSPVGGGVLSFLTLSRQCLPRGRHVISDPDSPPVHQRSKVASLIPDQPPEEFIHGQRSLRM